MPEERVIWLSSVAAPHTPFLNVQDGFLTTHTIENVLLPELEMMKLCVGDPNRRLRNLMDPEIPLMSGVVQNQDSYLLPHHRQGAHSIALGAQPR